MKAAGEYFPAAILYPNQYNIIIKGVIIMKTGRNIEELGKELLRQRQIRKDFVADTRCLDIDTDEYGGSTICLYAVLCYSYRR